MGKRVFVLWRQDDNGNQFVVGSHDDRTGAEQRLTELSRLPHKQTYWIAEQGAGECEDDTDESLQQRDSRWP